MPLAFLVLTAAPGSGHVTEAAVSAALDALGGHAPGHARWLSPGSAWEASLDVPAASLPAVRAAVSAAIGAVPVDVNVVPAGEGRRVKRLLSADMESTIIEQELIDEIAGLAGRHEEVRRVTQAAMRGEIDFAGSLVHRVALFEGLEVSRIMGLLERVTLMPGAEALVRTMAAQGARTALISGGFTLFAEPIARRVGFDAVFANVLEIANGRLTGKVAHPILGPEGKAETLRTLAREGGLDPSETLAVGDGANDLAMIGAAGLGVAFRPKPVLAKAARAAHNGAVIAHGDLTALLNLQGLGTP